MNILGISCYYHDAAAALIQNGRVSVAAEEERFTRKKHDNRFPDSAIEFCLRHAGLNINDIDLVCFYEKPLRKLERVLTVAKWQGGENTDLVKKQLSLAMNEQLFFDKVLEQKFGYTGPVYYADHHLSHAASSFYLSPYQEAAILTVDGVGEWATTLECQGSGTGISTIREIRYPHSLGLLYTTFTAFLGFKANNDEYKVMGLASYGEAKYKNKVEQLITQMDDSSFCLDMRYFEFMSNTARMYSDGFIDLFGQARTSEETVRQYHMDLAASLQAVVEEKLVNLGEGLYKKTGSNNLCLSGGVALNCVANYRLQQSTSFENIWVQPAAGDSGAAIGAGLLAYYENDDTRVAGNEAFSVFLGPSFTTDEIREYLEAQGASYTEYHENELYQTVAKLIYRNRIVGWFQGAMEFGPRALGNRSILANPCNPDMKQILNSRIKFREDFRPFAPAVMEEYAKAYFDYDASSPYMTFVAPVKDGKEDVIPAVTHVDQTARLQTVSESNNSRFHNLIDAFREVSGVPILINTSFNIRGEPIVCTPEDAYRCFMKTDIDYLVLDRFVVEKEV